MGRNSITSRAFMSCIKLLINECSLRMVSPLAVDATHGIKVKMLRGQSHLDGWGQGASIIIYLGESISVWQVN